MENFQFRLVTYHLEAQIFLRNVAPDILTIVSWCGSFRNMFVSHTVPRHTYDTSRKLFCHTPGLTQEKRFCHTPGLTQATSQLHLRPGRPMFAPADFDHSEM